jgi:hypothetical protein
MQVPPNTTDLSSVLHPARRRVNLSTPIFVLGSVRSGTSAMGYALTKGAGIPGNQEGHVSTLMQMVLNAVDTVTGNFPGSGDRYLLSSLDTQGFKNHVINYFQAFFEERYPSGVWCDKTPNDFDGAPAVRVAPLLLEMFPNARFVYCQRRGIENVLSRVTKFPQTPFWYHCRSWASTVTAWHEVRSKLGDRWLEVKQERMALEPDKVSDELARFLGLSAVQRESVLQTFLADRPEQSRPAGEDHELSMKQAGWDTGLQGVFIKECGPAMKLAGYSLDGGTIGEEQGLKLFCSTAEGLQGTYLQGIPRSAHVALNRDEFTLGPGPVGVRGTLLYTGLRLAGRSNFRSGVSVIGPAGVEVDFEVEVDDSFGRRLAHAKVRARSGESPARLELALPGSDLGLCNVRICTEAKSGTLLPEHRAVWQSPAFYS